MKVIEFTVPGGPEVLRYVERPTPEPGPGEIRVRAEAVGISSADVRVRKGIYDWMPPLPAIPGNEMAGVVDAIGPAIAPDATRLQVGQRVLVSSRELAFRGGCYAEAICIPAEAAFVLPPAVSSAAAVALPNYQLAGALLFASGVNTPRSVAVYGAAGGVGGALLQLAAAEGIRAIGIAGTEEKRTFTRAAGTRDVLLRGSPTLAQEVKALTGGHGVDVVYGMAGPEFIGNLDLLAPLGTLVSFSPLGGGMPEVDVFAALRKLLGRSLGLRVYSIHTLDHDLGLRRQLMERAIDLMADGRLLPPVPTLLPLRDAARAHEMLEAGTTLGKLVLTP